MPSLHNFDAAAFSGLIILVRVAQFALVAMGTYGLCFAKAFKRLRKTEAEANDLRYVVNMVTRKLEQTETERDATKREHEADLRKWHDHIAADVAQDIDDVADRLMEAIEAHERGENVVGMLYDIHMDLEGMWGYVISMTEE